MKKKPTSYDNTFVREANWDDNIRNAPQEDVETYYIKLQYLHRIASGAQRRIELQSDDDFYLKVDLDELERSIEDMWGRMRYIRKHRPMAALVRMRQERDDALKMIASGNPKVFKLTKQ